MVDEFERADDWPTEKMPLAVNRSRVSEFSKILSRHVDGRSGVMRLVLVYKHADRVRIGLDESIKVRRHRPLLHICRLDATSWLKLTEIGGQIDSGIQSRQLNNHWRTDHHWCAFYYALVIDFESAIGLEL